MKRKGRALTELRKIEITPHANKWAEGSAYIQQGNTKVHCTASVLESTPHWLNVPNQGWLSAEYNMLPRSTHSRITRERGFNSGRAQEISRLIGRSLRASLDLKKLGERQILIDCDVMQADGGTRTAAITGGFVALGLALNHLKETSLIPEIPLKYYVSACSLGLIDQDIYLDLDFKEDKTCDTDINFVFNSQNQIIELQGTAEKQSFTKDQLSKMVDMATQACGQLFEEQKKIVGRFFSQK